MSTVEGTLFDPQIQDDQMSFVAQILENDNDSVDVDAIVASAKERVEPTSNDEVSLQSIDDDFIREMENIEYGELDEDMLFMNEDYF